MKISIPIMVDVYFDIDEEDQPEVDMDQVRKNTEQAIIEMIDTDSMVDFITDETGWCIQGLAITIPE